MFHPKIWFHILKITRLNCNFEVEFNGAKMEINELKIRREGVIKRMKQEGIDACLISSNTNIIYLSGLLYSGYLYLNCNGDVIHFVKRPNNLQLSDPIIFIRKPEEIPNLLKEKNQPIGETIALEEDEMSYSDCIRVSKIFPDKTIKNCSSIIRAARAIKTEYELELFRIAAQKQSDAIREFPKLFRPGMTDNEFAIEMEYEIRKRGSIGVVRVFGESMEIFMGSVLTGENAATPSAFDFALGGAGLNPTIPVGHNNTPLNEGQTVMVDICGNFNGYHSDQTRVFSVGKTSQKALYAHQVSIEILNTIKEMGKEGVACCELYEKAIEIVKQHNLTDCFMGATQKASFIGHGVGLVLNELPVLTAKNKSPLTAGMTIAIEPKFIIDKIGAVGNEDTFAVRKNQAMEQLTNAPEEIIIL